MYCTIKRTWLGGAPAQKGVRGSTQKTNIGRALGRQHSSIDIAIAAAASTTTTCKQQHHQQQQQQHQQHQHHHQQQRHFSTLPAACICSPAVCSIFFEDVVAFVWAAMASAAVPRAYPSYAAAAAAALGSSRKRKPAPATAAADAAAPAPAAPAPVAPVAAPAPAAAAAISMGQAAKHRRKLNKLETVLCGLRKKAKAKDLGRRGKASGWIKKLATSAANEIMTDLANDDVPPPQFADPKKRAKIRACIQEFARTTFHDLAKRLPRGPRAEASMPFQETLWWKLFKANKTREPGTPEYDRWLLRFRVLVLVFEKFIDRFVAEGWDTKEGNVNSFGRPVAPFFMKMMAAFRYLSRGECFDTISELTQDTISEEVIRKFVKDVFLPRMHSLKAEYIFYPKTTEELATAEAMYRRVGLHGYAISLAARTLLAVLLVLVAQCAHLCAFFFVVVFFCLL